jgi:hypothetical protein
MTNDRERSVAHDVFLACDPNSTIRAATGLVPNGTYLEASHPVPHLELDYRSLRESTFRIPIPGI